MRIRVTDVLELLAIGHSQSQIVEELEIEMEDVQAFLQYAIVKL